MFGVRTLVTDIRKRSISDLQDNNVSKLAQVGDLHMISKSLDQQKTLDLFEEPVASRDASNEDNVLLAVQYSRTAF